MTDVRERVARAIAKVLYLDGEPGDDTETGTAYLLADAALSAIGWEEMVKALENMTLLAEHVERSEVWGSSVFGSGFRERLSESAQNSRAALSRARGEKT